MAREANNMRTIARNALAYMENEIHSANKNLKRVDDLDNDISGADFSPQKITAFKNKLKGDSKKNVENVTKMLRWLFTEFGISTIPSAYTDSQVDTLDQDIRSHEVSDDEE